MCLGSCVASLREAGQWRACSGGVLPEKQAVGGGKGRVSSLVTFLPAPWQSPGAGMGWHSASAEKRQFQEEKRAFHSQKPSSALRSLFQAKTDGKAWLRGEGGPRGHRSRASDPAGSDAHLHARERLRFNRQDDVVLLQSDIICKGTGSTLVTSTPLDSLNSSCLRCSLLMFATEMPKHHLCALLGPLSGFLAAVFSQALLKYLAAVAHRDGTSMVLPSRSTFNFQATATGLEATIPTSSSPL